ncbi:MAG: hypothetical protein JSS53_01750 [Proteobacteria bacterium]|nr:hypothetical protein [Pseudomonadota bacterium]
MEAINEGLADPIPLDQLPNVIKNKMWDPVYLPYRRVKSTLDCAIEWAEKNKPRDNFEELAKKIEQGKKLKD